MKKFVLTLTIVLAMTLVVVASAFAAPPDRQIFEFDDVYYIDDCSEFGFGEFHFYNRSVGTARVDHFYDKDGNFIRERVHVQGTDHLFAEDYPDKSLDGSFVYNWTAQVDPSTGEFTFSHDSGNWWHINLSGFGNMVRYTGMENFTYNPETDEWETIKRAGLFYYDKEAVCEYLAPSP